MTRTTRTTWPLALIFAATVIAPQLAQADDAKRETRLFTFSTCPTTGPTVYDSPGIAAMAPLVAGLVSAVVSPLIEGVVDKGVNALKEAAKDKDFQIPPPTPVIKNFYEIGVSGQTSFNRQIGCMVLVRGEFEVGNFSATQVVQTTPLPERIAAKFLPSSANGDTPQPGDQYIRVKPGSLEFYFEVVPVLSDDGKMFGLRPQALHVASFTSKDGFFGSSQRNYQFTITFTDPFGTQAFASADFKYEGLEKPLSKMSCVAVPAKDYCPAVELGGIRGWFATKPISDDFAPIIKKRQANAVTLKTAITVLPPPSPRPVIPDDDLNVSNKLDTYCKALAISNRPKLAGQQQWDDRCPVDLALAKREYVYAESNRAAELDKKNADDFWAKKCVDAGGQAFAPNDANLVACLKKLAEGKDTVPAGKFLLTSTIVETRPGNKLAAFLAPAAEKVGPAMKAALKEKLDPVEKEKAALAAASTAATDAKAKRDALNAVTLADDAVKSAQITYDAALAAEAASPGTASLQVASITAHIALVKAQIAANDAYRAADLPIPFPSVG